MAQKSPAYFGSGYALVRAKPFKPILAPPFLQSLCLQLLHRLVHRGQRVGKLALRPQDRSCHTWPRGSEPGPPIRSGPVPGAGVRCCGAWPPRAAAACLGCFLQMAYHLRPFSNVPIRSLTRSSSNEKSQGPSGMNRTSRMCSIRTDDDLAGFNGWVYRFRINVIMSVTRSKCFPNGKPRERIVVG